MVESGTAPNQKCVLGTLICFAAWYIALPTTELLLLHTSSIPSDLKAFYKSTLERRCGGGVAYGQHQTRQCTFDETAKSGVMNTFPKQRVLLLCFPWDICSHWIIGRCTRLDGSDLCHAGTWIRVARNEVHIPIYTPRKGRRARAPHDA